MEVNWSEEEAGIQHRHERERAFCVRRGFGIDGKALKGRQFESCTILTTDANALLKDIHNRMPVILNPDDYDAWLDPGENDPAHVADLLKPFDARLMRVYPVSSTVNSVKNDGPECAEEVSAGQDSPAQSSLF